MIRPASLLIWFALTIVVSVGLYNTSYRTQELRVQLKALNAQIQAEQGNIHVLKAEWGYLANPARIEAAAKKYLPLKPTAPKQVAQMDRLPTLFPTPTEALASAKTTVVGTTAAPVRKLASSEPATGYVNTRMVIQRSDDATPAVSGKVRLLLADFGSTP